MDNRKAFTVDDMSSMPDTILESLADNYLDFNITNELILDHRYLLHPHDDHKLGFWHSALSANASNFSSTYVPCSDINSYNLIPHQINLEQGIRTTSGFFSSYIPSSYTNLCEFNPIPNQIEGLTISNFGEIPPLVYSPIEVLDPKTELSQSLSIEPSEYSLQQYSQSLRVVSESGLAEETGFHNGRTDEEGTRKFVYSPLKCEDLESTNNKIELRHRPPISKHEKSRNTRMVLEKDVSLQVLRQYFSGSLKDAAKSIGICPTTLKSICRKHGIRRWPSRKIKKIGDSLKKIQHVIDSVQGVDSNISLGCFYSNFPELSSTGLRIMSSLSKPNSSNHFEPQLSVQPSSSSGQSNSHSQSGSSSWLCSAGAKIVSIDSLPPLPKRSRRGVFGHEDAFQVKAVLADKKIRFSMPQNWQFRDLKGAIVRRFNIDNDEEVGKMKLEYLDDDGEWVVLMSDADLEECMDIHRCSRRRTIRISIHQMRCCLKTRESSSGITEYHHPSSFF